MEKHIRYDARGRRGRRWTTGRIVLLVVVVVVLLWIVGYTVFNMGGTVPGSGEGDQISL
jgi:hypothetical protein